MYIIRYTELKGLRLPGDVDHATCEIVGVTDVMSISSEVSMTRRSMLRLGLLCKFNLPSLIYTDITVLNVYFQPGSEVAELDISDLGIHVLYNITAATSNPV